MLKKLIDHIESYIPISDDLKERLEEIGEVQHATSGEFLHKPGLLCDKTYFILSGLLRVFYKKDSKEITEHFAAENEWVTSIYSFLKNIPDHHYIQTLEQSDLVVIKLNDLEKCFQDFHEMNTFGRILMSKYYLVLSERMISIQFQSARDRYDFFLKTSGNKIQRVPLGMLASYLGMTQETLSRVRADRTPF